MLAIYLELYQFFDEKVNVMTLMVMTIIMFQGTNIYFSKLKL